MRRVVISFSSPRLIFAGGGHLHHVRTALREVAEHMRLYLMKPGKGSRLASPDGFCHRHELLADEDPKQTDESDDRRGGRTDIEQAVDHAHQQAGTE
ncbi:hypothetical protein AJ87_48445 [Rhizobium yanglingense]|nr:hypothetical protein AJ87_48445 [Rhizobium yanglingense]